MVVTALACASACGGPGTDPLQVDQTTGDGGGMATSANPPPTPFTDPFAGAPPFSPKGGGGGGGSHNAGEACGKQGCHTGGDGPAFLIGGTIYTDYKGTTPAAGVEIRIVDGNGNAASTYSEGNGNFYIRSGMTSVGFPAVVGARNGSIARPMITQLSNAGMGTCAQATCHTAPPSGYYPIHIP